MPRKDAKKPILKESEIQSQILNFLQNSKILHWRMPVDGIRSGSSGVRRRSPLKGFPDVAALYRGAFVTIEVKGEKGKLSSEQVSWIENLTEHGGAHVTAKCLEDVVNLLIDIDQQIDNFAEGA